MTFPEMNGIVGDIKTQLGSLLDLKREVENSDRLHSKEISLDEKLTELGCVCYNLYIDSKLFNNKVLSLCDSICSINHEITNGLDVAAASCEYPRNYEDGVKPIGEKKYVTNSKLKVTCPYGMEPIPPDFKKCICGYRNKREASFCGRCGAKLS